MDRSWVNIKRVFYTSSFSIPTFEMGFRDGSTHWTCPIIRLTGLPGWVNWFYDAVFKPEIHNFHPTNSPRFAKSVGTYIRRATTSIHIYNGQSLDPQMRSWTLVGAINARSPLV